MKSVALQLIDEELDFMHSFEGKLGRNDEISRERLVTVLERLKVNIEDSLDIDSLREKLAEIEHTQWVQWSGSIARVESVSEERYTRWSSLWVPYTQLSEEEKDKDRVWADEVLNLLREEEIING